MKPSQSEKDVSSPAPAKNNIVFSINGLWVSYAHTACAGGAFLCALIVGCLLHFDKIVQNEYFGYPQEWFPSVSATIGDRYPERSVYQLLIALTSGPRFLLVFLTYLLTARPGAVSPKALFVVGILRTFTCGGWTYVTSTDDHDWHDIFMIGYIVLTLPWTILRTILTPKGTKAKRFRVIVASTFFSLIVPLIYFFIQHKVHHIPGAYTIYAFFEWSLVLLDVAFDAGAAYDFPALEVSVLDTQSVTQTKTDISVLRDPSRLRKGPPVIGFVVSIVNWALWWSVFTSVGAMLWYFPLWYMGISGYEAWTVAFIAPLLLAIPCVRVLFMKLPQLAFAGQTLAIASYWVVDPPKRMTCVGIGAGFGSIALASVFRAAASSSRPGVLASQATTFVLGLMITVVIRIPYFTNNPLWPIMNPSIGGLNHWGVALGVVGAACAGTMVPDRTGSVTAPRSNSLISAFSLGSIIFLVSTFLSDVSSLPLWVWDGFPLRGPAPLPHGLLTLFAVALGLYSGITSRVVLSRRALLGFNISMILLSVQKHWIGFAGGLFVAYYTGAILPLMLENAARHNPGISFGIGMVVTVSYFFAETWTVAYAFVPGGWLLRERTWVVLLAQQLFVSAGAVNLTSDVKLSTASRKIAKLAGTVLVGLLSFSTLFTLLRLQHVVPAPVHPETHTLSAGIWTIHFGLDNMLWASETRMRDLIQDAELDVVGLLESDTQRTVGGHRDITQRIAEDLGFYVDYGPPSNQHTWGAALLSRFPILNSTHHLTPSPVGELAPAIHATLNVYGEQVDVVVFHSGQEEDPEDRRQQTAYLSDVLASTGTRPTILLSYLVTKPLEGNYNTWVSEYTGMHDIDPSDWDRWCEYILYKNMRRTGYARISRSTITDTELQVGRFQVGQDADYSNTRVEEHEVEERLRFPTLFRGEGVRGHRYHVFDEPRYFS